MLPQPNLLAAHVCSGSNTVVQCYRERLTSESSESWQRLVHDATSFMTECYGKYNSTTMTAVRRRLWKGKFCRANNYCFCTKASVTTPTGETFQLNAKPSHFQACIWRHARESRLPLLDQLEHGLIWDTVNTILTPVMWSAGCHLHLTTYR